MPRGIRSERVVVQCANCGKDVERRKTDLERKKTDRAFCTRECQYEAGSKPRRTEPKVCEQCGGEFMVYGKQRVGRFCTKTCYNEWQARNRVERTCEQCGETFSVSPSYETRQPARFCTKACESASRIKRPLGRAHNGKAAVLDNQGYVRVFEPDHPKAMGGGWVFEHRLLVERDLGRQLDRNEHVHHINGDKSDNRLQNLVVMGGTEHLLLSGDEYRQHLQKTQDELAAYRKRYGPIDL